MFALICRDESEVEELSLTGVGDRDVVQIDLEPHPQHVQLHHGDQGHGESSL